MLGGGRVHYAGRIRGYLSEKIKGFGTKKEREVMPLEQPINNVHSSVLFYLTCVNDHMKPNTVAYYIFNTFWLIC